MVSEKKGLVAMLTRMMGCNSAILKLHLRIIGYNSNRVCLECASQCQNHSLCFRCFSLKFSEVMMKMFVCNSLFNFFSFPEDDSLVKTRLSKLCGF